MLTKGRGAEMRILAACAVALLLGTVACGDRTSSRATAAPSPIAPSVTGLIIGGPDAVRTGFASDYTVSVSLSDGSSKLSASASCTSSDPSVASIDAPCRLTGNKHGSTTLTVSTQGRTTSKTVNVVNNYGGSWTGLSHVTTCNDDPGFIPYNFDEGWCEALHDAQISFSLILTQSGSGQDQISGNIDLSNLGNEPVRVSGSVTNDGRLLLSGSSVITAYPGAVLQLSIGGWDTILSANTIPGGHDPAMTGGWDLSFILRGNGKAFQHQTILWADQR